MNENKCLFGANGLPKELTHHEANLYCDWDDKSDDDLTHWGILGMHWGVRRYQNKDGSLTPAGKARLKKEQEKYAKKEASKQQKAYKQAVSQQKKQIKAVEKAQKTAEKEQKKAEKNFRETQKKKLKAMKEGPEAVLKNANLFSDAEINAYANRQQALDRLKPRKEEPKSSVDKFAEKAQKIKRGADAAGNIFDAYTKVAGISNKVLGTTLPEFNTEKEAKKKTEKRIKELQKISFEDVLKDPTKYSTQELQDFSKRNASLDSLQKSADAKEAKRLEKAKKYKENTKAYENQYKGTYGSSNYSAAASDWFNNSGVTKTSMKDISVSTHVMPKSTAKKYSGVTMDDVYDSVPIYGWNNEASITYIKRK